MRTSLFSAVFSLGLFATVLATEFQVTVGGPGILQFDPEFVNASAGDTVVFSFRQENHTVSQSTLETPCELADGGFDSGFVPVAANNTFGPFPVAQLTVTDTNPIWIFCRQTGHCQQGMVFAVNPGDQLSTFKANAFGNNTANSSASTSSSITASSSASITSSATATSTTDTSTSAVARTASAPAATSSAAVGVANVTTIVTVSETATVTASITGSAASSAPSYVEHIVAVGADGELVFEPSNITANVGDIVTFMFMHANHSATQSSFSDPCKSLTETSTSGQMGFDSGFMPVANGSSNFPTFTIEVNDTSPAWVYCKQTNPADHCAAGMVFSVNAVESGLQDFSAFQTAAKQSNVTTGSSHSGCVLSVGSSRNAGVALTLLVIVIGLVL